MALFYLLTLYGFIRGVESRSPTLWFALSIAACFLGMATKEVMVTAPLLVLLLDATIVSGNFRQAWTQHRRLYLALAGSWLLLACFLTDLSNQAVGYTTHANGWAYALIECRAIVLYLRLALSPHPLILDYGEYMPPADPLALAPYALILAALALSVLFAWKRQPALAFIGAWFFVILAPTSSVVPVTASPTAEHRMYLPLASVIALAVVGTAVLGKQVLRRQQGAVLAALVGGLVAVLLTFLTIQRNRDYQSAPGIWQDTVQQLPTNYRALANLGLALAQQGNPQEAIGYYEQALLLKPDFAVAHYDLGCALAQQDRLPEAIAQYQQALQLKPDLAEAHNDLGNELLRMSKVQEAIGHYEAALQLNPDSIQTRYNLGVALEMAGRVPEAITLLDQVARATGDYSGVKKYLGYALLQQGQFQQAVPCLRQWVQANPNDAEALGRLGAALSQIGDNRNALDCLNQALRIKPDMAEAQNNLAWLLATLPAAQGGDPLRAVNLAQRACELTGNNSAGNIDTLAIAYAAAGRFDDAVATAQKAIDLARATGRPKLADEIESRLQLYRSGQAYRPVNVP
jgi:tetratricopeptide (TPR) repeat protein